MTIYERLRFLAMGGKKAYLHGATENMKTTELQEFLDFIYWSNPKFYRKFHWYLNINGSENENG